MLFTCILMARSWTQEARACMQLDLKLSPGQTWLFSCWLRTQAQCSGQHQSQHLAAQFANDMKHISAHSGRQYWFNRKCYLLSHVTWTSSNIEATQNKNYALKRFSDKLAHSSLCSHVWHCRETAFPQQQWNFEIWAVKFCQWHQSQISRWTQHDAMQSARRLPLWLCRRGTTGRRDGQRPSHNWDAWTAPSPSSDATSLLIHGRQVPWSEWLPNHNAPLSFGNARSSGNIERSGWSRSDGAARCPTRCKFVSRQSSADLSI